MSGDAEVFRLLDNFEIKLNKFLAMIQVKPQLPSYSRVFRSNSLITQARTLRNDRGEAR